jgi:long-chain fatty acid transport protein
MIVSVATTKENVQSGDFVPRTAPYNQWRSGTLSQGERSKNHFKERLSMLTARRSRAVSVACAMALAGWGSNAFASGFQLQEQSASRLGAAFSGTAAAAEDASVLFYNPAGMSRLKQSEIAVVATGIRIKSEFNDDSSVAAFGQSLGTDGGDAGGWNFVPSVYAALPVTDKLAVGFGVNAPFGLELDYDGDSMARFQARRSMIKTYNLNPAISYRIADRITLGLGLDYQHIKAELSNSVNYSAVVAQGLQQLVLAGQIQPAALPTLIGANAGLEGYTRLKGDDNAWGFNAGLLFELSDSSRLGLAYRSSMSYTVDGDVTFVTPTASNPTGAAIIANASAPGGPLANGDVSVDLKLPDTATASFVQEFGDQWELSADLAWTGWSSVQELRVVRDNDDVLSLTPEQWDDTWRFAVGGAFKVNPSFKLRAGIAYDQTPVPSSTRTARLPDAARRWIAFGANWTSGPVILDVGLAHLFVKDAPIDQDGGNAVAYGNLVGEQQTDIDILSVQVGYQF